jgi:hypothetical protein
MRNRVALAAATLTVAGATVIALATASGGAAGDVNWKDDVRLRCGQEVAQAWILVRAVQHENEQREGIRAHILMRRLDGCRAALNAVPGE